MFESLEMAPPDSILGLGEAFRNDPNSNKINLTVGVYKDEHGRTPILACVKEAERRLLESEPSKEYLGITGSDEFGRLVRELAFGADGELSSGGRAVTVQTPGGTAALRVVADLLQRKFPAASIWCSQPTWANHPGVFQAAGVDVQSYAYIDSAGTGLDFDALLGALQQVPQGDVVCLHACCHNPTGIDPSPAQWSEIGRVINQRGILPLVDFAYQGFGDGLDEDADGLRTLCQSCPELLMCSSFSKNFGLYGERVGALTIVARDADAAQAALSHAKTCVRQNYSNPPRHGALIVSTIFNDAELRSQWLVELAGMRDRINGMRQLFADRIKQRMPDRDFSFITDQRGMFSYSGLTPLQVDTLRSEHAIYMVGSGRINVAGITPANIDRLCNAIAAVL